VTDVPGYERVLLPREASVALRADLNKLRRLEAAGDLTAIRTPSGHRRYLERSVTALKRKWEKEGRP